MTHLDVLREALNAPCICDGRAVPAWEQILTLNGHNVMAYCESVYQAFAAGGGKGFAHLYIGEPSSGKTALTRALLELFGDKAFVKPQAGTSFALEGLIGADALIWNDFRWPNPPLAWNDLLNVLDNEPFQIGVPKTDGQKDYRWNSKGNEGVVAFLTTNVPIVYVKGDRVDHEETKAFNERFGENVYMFRERLPNPDRRYKQWCRCYGCWARWVCKNAQSFCAPCINAGSARPREAATAADLLASPAIKSPPRQKQRLEGQASDSAAAPILPSIPRTCNYIK